MAGFHCNLVLMSLLMEIPSTPVSLSRWPSVDSVQMRVKKVGRRLDVGCCTSLFIVHGTKALLLVVIY